VTAWLRETLAGSDAVFKVIASPVPLAAGSAPMPSALDKWDGYLAERDALFDFLDGLKPSGMRN